METSKYAVEMETVTKLERAGIELQPGDPFYEDDPERARRLERQGVAKYKVSPAEVAPVEAGGAADASLDPATTLVQTDGVNQVPLEGEAQGVVAPAASRPRRSR